MVTITGDNAGVMHGKLMQFASGTLYTGENHENDYEVIHTEKLQMTDYLPAAPRAPSASAMILSTSSGERCVCSDMGGASFFSGLRAESTVR